MSYANLGYVLPSGTSAGSNTINAWTQYPINTEISDSDGVVTLASNQFQVNAGTLEFHIASGLHNTGGSRICLYNVTQDNFVKIGTSLTGHPAVITGHTDSNGSDWYEVRYYTLTYNAGDGLGRQVGTGQDELYLDVNLWLTPDD